MAKSMFSVYFVYLLSVTYTHTYISMYIHMCDCFVYVCIMAYRICISYFQILLTFPLCP